MVMDSMQSRQDRFRIPNRFNQLVVDLNTGRRTDELILERTLQSPALVKMIFQSDSETLKHLRIVSESEIIGRDAREDEIELNRLIGPTSTSASLLLGRGKYALYLTSEKAPGKLVVGYQETPYEPEEFARLERIHRGELTNPPDGYQEVYSTSLSGLSLNEDTVYTLTLDSTQSIGVSIYTSAREGYMSVDFIGDRVGWWGLVGTEHRILDQLEITLTRGEYHFRLTCDNADGEVYIYVKTGQEVR